MEQFSEKIKTLRKSAKLTQQDLADALGIHLQTVSKWERGLFEPDISYWAAIASVFHLTLEGFFELEEMPESFSHGAFRAESLGEAITQYRKAANLNQSELAKKLNVTADTVSKWERGVTCPDFASFLSLTRLFHVPFSVLYYGQSEGNAVLPVKKKRSARLWIILASALALLVAVTVGVCLWAKERRSLPPQKEISSPADQPSSEGEKEKTPYTRIVYGGTFDWLAESPVRLAEGESFTLTAPVRNGYSFVGWNLQADGLGEYCTEVSYLGDKQITLYSVWVNDRDLAVDFVYTADGAFYCKRLGTCVEICQFIPEKAKSPHLVLPATVCGLPVRSIADSAFAGIDAIESVTLANSVEIVKSNAFENCKNLKKVVFGKSLREIRSAAFASCSSIESVEWNEKLSFIGERAFADCSSLGFCDFSASLEEIGKEAFCGCSALTQIYLPERVCSIGEDAFARCPSLTKISVSEDNPYFTVIWTLKEKDGDRTYS